MAVFSVLGDVVGATVGEVAVVQEGRPEDGADGVRGNAVDEAVEEELAAGREAAEDAVGHVRGHRRSVVKREVVNVGRQCRC